MGCICARKSCNLVVRVSVQMSNSWNTSWDTVGDYTGLSGSGGNFSNSNSKSSSGGGFWSSVGENLPKIAKGIGAGADIYQSLTGGNQIGFDSEFIKESTEKIKKESEKTLEDMFNVFDISNQVYGVTAENALQEYYQRYGDVIEDQFRRGSDLLYNFDPDFTNQRQRLATDIDSAIKQYSQLANPLYMGQALNPQIVKVDPESIYGALDFSPEKGYNINNPLMRYDDSYAQALIKGGEESLAGYAARLVDPTGSASKLMTYNV